MVYIAHQPRLGTTLSSQHRPASCTSMVAATGALKAVCCAAAPLGQPSEDELRDVLVIREDSEYYGKFKRGVGERNKENLDLYFEIIEKII